MTADRLGSFHGSPHEAPSWGATQRFALRIGGNKCLPRGPAGSILNGFARPLPIMEIEVSIVCEDSARRSSGSRAIGSPSAFVEGPGMANSGRGPGRARPVRPMQGLVLALLLAAGGVGTQAAAAPAIIKNLA